MSASAAFEGDLVSVIVPTIGRPAPLRRLLLSLAAQTLRPGQVLIADGSDNREVESVVADPHWIHAGLQIRHIPVFPPNAVAQRIAAITKSNGKYLLFVDDDVELDTNCIEEMLLGVNSAPGVVAVVADFANERWSGPTSAWRCYMRMVLGLKEGEWEGRVVGPLLRFGFPMPKDKPVPMEWIGTCNSLVSRAAYDSCGGFSKFFLHRCTMNEDVDLGLKLARQGTILFWPAARLSHYHAPSGRVTAQEAAEDDVFNRYGILVQTLSLGRRRALGQILLFVFVESSSNLVGAIFGRHRGARMDLFVGRLRGLWRAARQRM